jgi:general secretion pathway protein I
MELSRAAPGTSVGGAGGGSRSERSGARQQRRVARTASTPWRPAAQRTRARGFTLLEVLVAVAILGLSLTAILSAQAGAISGASHARYMSLSVGLARCKMSEIEQQLARDGFQETDVNDSGPCCEGDETPNITCSWRIEKPQFPEASAELDLDTDIGSGQLGALGALGKSEGGDQVVMPDAGIKGVAEALAGGGTGDLASMASGGMSSIASMVMSMVYPDLKTLFEAATRRATVTLTWTEGVRSYDVTLVQWIADPKQAGIVGSLPGEGEDATPVPSGTATGTATRTSTGTSTRTTPTHKLRP